METAPELDALMARAWPPATVEDLGGWKLRYTSGITRRANSVLTPDEPHDLLGAITAVEAFYEQRNAKPTFMVSEATSPGTLTKALLARGYVSSSTTCVLWATAAAALAGLPTGYTGRFLSSDGPSDTWFDTYWAVDPGNRFNAIAAPIIRDVLLRPASRAVFVSAFRDDAVESVGQVVIGGGWGCIQCLATPASARRRGAGSAVVRKLVLEAQLAGVDRVFAAVVASNAASLRLFERAGFELSHQYSYYVPGAGRP